jgi:hypothetical protein
LRIQIPCNLAKLAKPNVFKSSLNIALLFLCNQK